MSALKPLAKQFLNGLNVKRNFLNSVQVLILIDGN